MISIEEWWSIIDTLGLHERLTNAKTIVIKPNLAAGTYVSPENHVISDLQLLKSTIEFVHVANKKAIIYIAESDSTGFGFAYLKFDHLNLPQCLELPAETEDCIRLLDLSRDRLIRVENADFKLYTTVDRQLWLSETLIRSGFTISLSNLKTHAVTGYTGACKNLFGCLPDSDKSVNHPRIHKVIHDLVIAIEPDLSVVDAFYGMERNGPVQGVDVDAGYRVFSDSSLEADVYSALSIGYPPKRIGYLARLIKTKDMAICTTPKVTNQYRRPTKFLRAMNVIGLTCQGCGQGIAAFGHRIHSCTTPANLAITVVRPALLKLFDYETLRELKRGIMHEQ